MSKFVDFARAARTHHWIKNSLLLLAWLDLQPVAYALLGRTILAFLAFSFCASAVYLLNDLFDKKEDVKNFTKRRRPIAAGRITIERVCHLIIFCLSVSVFFACFLPKECVAVLAGYFSLNLLYSLYFKSLKALDVLLLTSFYPARIAAGYFALGAIPPHEVLGIFFFAFLSLACVKRFSELRLVSTDGSEVALGRPYGRRDSRWLIASGMFFGAFFLGGASYYLYEEKFCPGCGNQQIFWFVLVLVGVWLARCWYVAIFLRPLDDLVSFVISDRFTYLIFAISAIFLVLTH